MAAHPDRRAGAGGARPRGAHARCRSTPPACRSPASKAGRPPRPGPACGCASWPAWPGVPESDVGVRAVGGTLAVPSTARRCRPIRCTHPDSLLALRVNGADLSPDHGYPGAHHRSGAARCAQHQMGRRHRLQDGADRCLTAISHGLRIASAAPADTRRRLRAVRLCGRHDRPAALWNPRTWWQSIAVWFAAAIIAHDLVLFPIYALVDRMLGRCTIGDDRRYSVPVLNYLRMPALGAALTLAGLPARDHRAGRADLSGRHRPDPGAVPGRWLLLTAAMFAISAVVYALRLATGPHALGRRQASHHRGHRSGGSRSASGPPSRPARPRSRCRPTPSETTARSSATTRAGPSRRAHPLPSASNSAMHSAAAAQQFRRPPQHP